MPGRHAKLNRLPLRYFDGHKTGDIMSRVTNDLEKVSSVMQVGLMQLVSSVFTIALAAAAMVMPQSLCSFWWCWSPGPQHDGHRLRLRPWPSGPYGGNMAAMGALTGKGGGAVRGQPGGQGVQPAGGHASGGEAEALNRPSSAPSAGPSSPTTPSIPPSACWASSASSPPPSWAAGMARAGYHPGHCAGLLQYVNQIAEPVTGASYVITSLQAAIAGAERVFALLDEEEERPDAAGDASRDHPGPRGVSPRALRLHPERTLIHDLNLEVRPNEMVAIVGPHRRRQDHPGQPADALL